MGQILGFHAPGEQVMAAITAALARHGYRVVRSFDLQTARAQHPEGCACPHRGTAGCTCQYIVALAYPPAQDGTWGPFVLTAHTYLHTTLVTVHSDHPAGSDDRRRVMGAVAEAAGDLAPAASPLGSV